MKHSTLRNRASQTSAETNSLLHATQTHPLSTGEPHPGQSKSSRPFLLFLYCPAQTAADSSLLRVVELVYSKARQSTCRPPTCLAKSTILFAMPFLLARGMLTGSPALREAHGSERPERRASIAKCRDRQGMGWAYASWYQVLAVYYMLPAGVSFTGRWQYTDTSTCTCTCKRGLPAHCPCISLAHAILTQHHFPLAAE